MSIYLVATYDLAGAHAALPDFIQRLEAEGAEIMLPESSTSLRLAEDRGVTLVLEFASEEAAEGWAGEPEWSSVRQAWLHPAGRPPQLRLDTLTDRSARPRTTRRRPRR